VLSNSYAWGVGLSGSQLRTTLYGKVDHDVPSGLTPGQWAHVAWVMQANGQARFYVDGLLIASVSGPAPTGEPYGGWHLGHKSGGELWDGGLDELQVYGFALTDDEVCSLANQPGTALELGSPLVCGPSAAPYGCDLFPLGSLGMPFGLPPLGNNALFFVDNPHGTQGAGALPFVFLATAPDPGFPCGTPFPGLGAMSGAQPGELLLSLGGPNPFKVLGGLPWIGPGVPAIVPLPQPNLPQLAGVSIYAQAVLVDGFGANPLVGTNGMELFLGY